MYYQYSPTAGWHEVLVGAVMALRKWYAHQTCHGCQEIRHIWYYHAYGTDDVTRPLCATCAQGVMEEVK